MLGFAGVVVLLGVQLSGDLGPAAMVLLAAFGYGIATLLVRRLSDVRPLAISAVSLSIAAVLLAPRGPRSRPTSRRSSPSSPGRSPCQRPFTAGALGGFVLILAGSWLAR